MTSAASRCIRTSTRSRSCPGNPDQFFVGSDGGVIRTSGTWADAATSATAGGSRPRSSPTAKSWLSRIPTELKVINAGLGTLQMNSIAVNQHKGRLGDDRDAGQRHARLPRARRAGTFPLTGDGGDAGFDAVDPEPVDAHVLRRPDGRELQRRRSDVVALDRRPVHRRLPEAIRFYTPTISDPVVSKTIFVGAQRVWRTQNAGGDRAFLEAHCNTAVGEFPSDLLFTGACGSANDWSPLGASTLTGAGVRGNQGRQHAQLGHACTGQRHDVVGHGGRPRPRSRGTPTRRRRA